MGAEQRYSAATNVCLTSFRDGGLGTRDAASMSRGRGEMMVLLLEEFILYVFVVMNLLILVAIKYINGQKSFVTIEEVNN